MGSHIDAPSRGLLGREKPWNLSDLVKEEAGDQETFWADEGMTW